MLKGRCSEVGSGDPALGTENQALQQSPASDGEKQMRVAPDQDLQSLLQLCPPVLDIAQQIAPLDLSSHRQPGSAGEWVTSERAGVITGFKDVGISANNQCPNGVTAPEALGQGKGIRFDPQLLVAPPRSGSSHADLHFIEDQQDPVGVAEATQLFEKGPVAWIHTTFALKRFDQHGGNRWAVGFVLVQQGLEGSEVVVREIVEPIDNGLETAVVFRLPCCRDGRQGAPMKAGRSREDDRALNATSEMAVLARQLDGSFIGFSP